jgi:hypothetical protein
VGHIEQRERDSNPRWPPGCPRTTRYQRASPGLGRLRTPHAASPPSPAWQPDVGVSMYCSGGCDRIRTSEDPKVTGVTAPRNQPLCHTPMNISARAAGICFCKLAGAGCRAFPRPGSVPGDSCSRPPLVQLNINKLAERQGFEPWRRFRLCLSKTAHLTALPPLPELQKARLAQMLHQVLLLVATLAAGLNVSSSSALASKQGDSIPWLWRCCALHLCLLHRDTPIWWTLGEFNPLSPGASRRDHAPIFRAQKSFKKSEHESNKTRHSLAMPLHSNYAMCSSFPFIRTPETGVASHAQHLAESPGALVNGAGCGNRTRVHSLEGWSLKPLGQARIWMPRVAAGPRRRAQKHPLTRSLYGRGIVNYKANC